MILHGAENLRPLGHWQYWLAEELRRRGEVVLYPQLPQPDAPSLSSWLELVHAELAQLGEGERVVIGHSLGAVTWLHLVMEMNEGERVDRVLLVSPPSTDALWPEVAEFAADSVTSEMVARSSTTTRIVCSDNDPYCPAGAKVVYGERLGVDVDLLPGGGHLAMGDGYGEWPSMLEWCLDPRVRVRK